MCSGAPGRRKLAGKKHWELIIMGWTASLCSPRWTPNPALPGGCLHCPFLPSCLLPSPLVLTGGERQPQLLCLLGLGPIGRYHCQSRPQLSGPTLSGHGDIWTGCCPCLSLLAAGATCVTESRPISTAICTGALAMGEQLLLSPVLRGRECRHCLIGSSQALKDPKRGQRRE